MLASLIKLFVIIKFVDCGGGSLQELVSDLSQDVPNENARIVGGETSDVMIPYQISLQMQSRGGGGSFFFQQPASNWYVKILF
jgi:hypothetical protein